jgi:hypothetical protein
MTDALLYRRRVLKRAVLWTLAAVLLLVGYIASPPLVGSFIADRVPATIPLLEIFYAPLGYYHDHPELPGSEAYGEYVEWCHASMQRNSD